MALLTVDAEEFRKAFAFVKHASGGPKDLKYHLLGLVFYVDFDEVHLVALAPEVKAEALVKAEFLNKAQTSGGISQVEIAAVPIDKLGKFLKLARGTALSISVDAEAVEFGMDVSVSLECYDARAHEEAHHRWDAADIASRPVFKAATLVDALGSMAECTSPSGPRMQMKHIELRDGNFLSSDGNRVRMYSNDLPNFVPLKIAAGNVKPLVAALKAMDSTELAFSTLSPSGWGHFYGSRYYVGVRMGDWRFPAVEENVIGAGDPAIRVALEVQGFEHGLKVAALGLGAGKDEITLLCGTQGLQLEAVNGVKRPTRVAVPTTEMEGVAAETLEVPISVTHLLESLPARGTLEFGIFPKRKAVIFADCQGNREILTAIPFRGQAGKRTIADEKLEKFSA